MKEKPLSEKVWTSPLSERDLFTKEDVAEALERLKERCIGITHCHGFLKLIDEIFGDLKQEDGE